MKCPNCNSTENRRYGWYQSRQGPIRRYKCKKCDRIFKEKNLGSPWKGRKLTDEHRRNIGSARNKWWNNLTPKQKAETCRKINEGRVRAITRKKKDNPPREKDNFIGKLGDIEVYAANFGRMGRPPKSVSSKWAGPAHGKPELKKMKPG